MILNIIIIFLIGFITDILWAMYINNVASKNKLSASIYSVLIGIFGLVVIETMIENSSIMIFWLLGLFFGTYLSFDINSIYEIIESYIKNKNKNNNIEK